MEADGEVAQGDHVGIRAELRLRVDAKPDPDAAQLLDHFGLQIPLQSKIIENAVPKIA